MEKALPPPQCVVCHHMLCILWTYYILIQTAQALFDGESAQTILKDIPELQHVPTNSMQNASLDER